MKRSLVLAAAICMVLVTGCAKVGGGASVPSSSQSVTDSADALPRSASIPTMEFLAASQLPEGGTLKPGASVPAGTYKPAVAGKDIASVQWAVSENDGINQEVLALHLSAAGTKHMATLTKSIVGHHLLVLLGGRVLSNELVTVPITHGQLAFDSAYVLSMRSEIDSATVPSP